MKSIALRFLLGLLLAILGAVAIPLFVTSSPAVAEPTPDEYFIMELKERGIPRPSDDGEAIGLAHIVVDGLVQSPTMKEVGELGNALMAESARGGKPMSMEQAGTFIRLAVHYYGPQWLQDSLDQQSG